MNNKINNFNNKKGYVMLLTTIIFMMVSLIIIFGITTPIIKQIFLSRDIWSAKQSYYLSEAGAEDVLYRLKDATYNQYVGSIEAITLNGYGATTTFSGSLSGIDGLTVTTLSDQNGYIKKIETKVKKGSGVSFTYGIQIGQGGFTMTGTSKIIGNVYSGGPISSCSSCQITGSAIVSNSPNIFADQSNDTPTSSPNIITFGDNDSTQDIAQSFKVSSTSPLTQISLYLKKVGSPSSAVVKIIKNNNGSPSSDSHDVVSSATLNSSLVTTNYDWVDVPLSPNPNLIVGTTYWIVIDGLTGNASKKYIIGANLDSNYTLGTSKIGSLGESWTNTSYDTYFRIYLGGLFGSIYGENESHQANIGTTASDIVWAHNVSYTNASGPIRCQNEIGNNKPCEQSFVDPSPVAFPVSDGNITEWKTEADDGGTFNGNYNAGDNSTLGPKKIIGNVSIGGGKKLTVTGTLHITGNLDISGSGEMQLGSSYGANSGIIVVDGLVTIGGSAEVSGSGRTGSYIMIVSDSSCPSSGSCEGHPAIDMAGSGGAVVLNAQKGTINFSGSAKANEATANMITMGGSTILTYQSGIANMNFSTGPSGSFNIFGWKELQN